MKKSCALTSRRSFERRVKTRLEQIRIIESSEPINSPFPLNNSNEENNDFIECDRVDDVDLYERIVIYFAQNCELV